MAWGYQKYENDCWLCALKNALFYWGISVSYEEMLDLLKKRGLAVLDMAGFFTYIPLILCDYGFDTIFYLPKEAVFYGETLWEISDWRIAAFLAEKYEKEKNGLCFLYQSMEQILKRPDNITVYRQNLNFHQCMAEKRIILAHMQADMYYGLKEAKDNHVVLVISGQDSYEVIDPFEEKGQERFYNWKKLKKNASKYNWSTFINCAVSIKGRHY